MKKSIKIIAIVASVGIIAALIIASVCKNNCQVVEPIKQDTLIEYEIPVDTTIVDTIK